VAVDDGPLTPAQPFPAQRTASGFDDAGCQPTTHQSAVDSTHRLLAFPRPLAGLAATSPRRGRAITACWRDRITLGSAIDHQEYA